MLRENCYFYYNFSSSIYVTTKILKAISKHSNYLQIASLFQHFFYNSINKMFANNFSFW